MLIAESSDGGLLEPDEQHRLHRALQLARRTARQLMVPRTRVAAVPVTLSPEALLHTATTSPFTRLPVYRGTIDTIVGMVHTKDVAAAYASAPDGAAGPTLRDLMRPVLSVPGSITAERLLTSLREKRSRLAVVLDEYGGVEGIVTLEDVLAEMVGDVADEFKGTDDVPERLPDGRIRLPGRLRLDEAAPWVGVEWTDAESDTVGGRVLTALGQIPVGGETLTVDGVRLEVERMDGSAVASVLATPAVDTEEDD
jgi:CBS domain containing-hemolysin-like protein